MISAATSVSLRDEERAVWRRSWNASKEGSPLRAISTPLACLLNDGPAVQGDLKLAGEPALLGSVGRGHQQLPEDAGIAADRLCLGL